VAYSKTKLKSGGCKASPCLRPFWIGKFSDKGVPIRTLLYVSFKHILTSLTGFMGISLYKDIVQYFPPNGIAGVLEVYE
jgi:hypothetical protein